MDGKTIKKVDEKAMGMMVLVHWKFTKIREDMKAFCDVYKSSSTLKGRIQATENFIEKMKTNHL